MWTCGDVFKTTYFVLRKAPPQFFICGSLQVYWINYHWTALKLSIVRLLLTWWSWARSGSTDSTPRRGRGPSSGGSCDRRPGPRLAQSRSPTPAASWTRTTGLRGPRGEVWRTPRSRTWKYCGRTLFWSPGDESRVLLKYNNHFIQMLPLLCQIIQPVSSFHLIRAASIFGTYILTRYIFNLGFEIRYNLKML